MNTTTRSCQFVTSAWDAPKTMCSRPAVARSERKRDGGDAHDLCKDHAARASRLVVGSPYHVVAL